MNDGKALLDEELLMLTTFPELIGGLAHEVAQPLNAISLICEVLRLKVDRLELSRGDAKFFSDKLENIKNQVLRATETVHGVRRYVSRGDDSSLGNLGNSLRTIGGLLRQQFISRGIDFDFDIQGEFRPVNFDSILLDLIVAGCLVFARNRVETLDFKHRQNGFKYSRRIQAVLSSVENKDLLLVEWDLGTLEEIDWNLDLPATLLVGLQASESLVSKLDGSLDIDNGSIRLTFHRR
jgi:signal transduction histidine kinase